MDLQTLLGADATNLLNRGSKGIELVNAAQDVCLDETINVA
jgi:hypothetical protein